MRNLLIGILVVIANISYSQSIGAYNISTVGKSAMSDDGGLYFAVGEPINTVIGDGDIIISQGFLQVAIESGTSETNQLLLSTLKVYPNPTSYELNLELLDTPGKYTASLYNVLGQQLAKTNLETTYQKIDLSMLAPGTYYLRVFDKEQNIGTFSIIKQ